MRNSEPKWSNTIFFLMIPREFPFLPLHMRYILPYKAMIIKAVSYWHNAKTKTCLHSTFILKLKCDFTAEIIFCRIDENKSKLGRRENWHHWSNVARLSKDIPQFVEINITDYYSIYRTYGCALVSMNCALIERQFASTSVYLSSFT